MEVETLGLLCDKLFGLLCSGPSNGQGRLLMQKISLEGLEIDPEKLSDHGREQLALLQSLEMQMAKLKSDIAAFHATYTTARSSYLQAIKADLAKSTVGQNTSKLSLGSLIKRQAGL